MAAGPAAGPALNSPESQSQPRLYRRGGAEDLRTSPDADEGDPKLDGAISASVQDRPSEANGGMMSMVKEYRTADELSGMILSALAVKDVAVQVRKDHAYGWQPIVVASPGDLIGYQRRVEEIANRLRLQFSLRQ
jgi:hypothetical protein